MHPRPRSQPEPSARQPHTPFLARSDIGAFSVYQGNWGGRSTHAETRHHIFEDILTADPLSIADGGSEETAPGLLLSDLPCFEAW